MAEGKVVRELERRDDLSETEKQQVRERVVQRVMERMLDRESAEEAFDAVLESLGYGVEEDVLVETSLEAVDTWERYDEDNSYDDLYYEDREAC